jgi:hypothetical protein
MWEQTEQERRRENITVWSHTAMPIEFVQSITLSKCICSRVSSLLWNRAFMQMLKLRPTPTINAINSCLRTRLAYQIQVGMHPSINTLRSILESIVTASKIISFQHPNRLQRVAKNLQPSIVTSRSLCNQLIHKHPSLLRTQV